MLKRLWTAAHLYPPFPSLAFEGDFELENQDKKQQQ
jgi:hypothetical protein